MKIAFTVCSNNYLSQAKVLGDSLTTNNPDYKFIIGLCDKRNDAVDYSPFDTFEIIEVENIGVENFDWMIYNYNIIELNTAVKPSFFLHFINTYPEAETIIYFDPDIKIFDKLTSIENDLKGHSAILTPHILTPLDIDDKIPGENVFLNYGIYNLGFFAIRPCDESIKLLKWWQNKLKTKCFDRACDGFFVDQLPMNYAPLFFENVQISSNLGYNVAYWNFHEREISFQQGKYYINKDIPLTFFHFSSFKPNMPLEISKHQNRYQLTEGSDLYILYKEYFEALIEYKYLELITVPCHYVVLRNQYLETRQKEWEKKRRAERYTVKNFFYFPIWAIKKIISNL
ncbi:glycosyl transferase [Dysgonomonas sp. 25]|uniref:glycosyl transferase n=1 Tax=Dysgonomonas sp. 25 TaxID=2302933 RepID=UPI0013D8965E|nr:glycosyl transferase [Dysgonomonas sp. 25]NDV69039.1 glycosyl transferase [Dysgonomonas sp. 25]